MTKKKTKIEEGLTVNKEAFTASLQALDMYLADLITNLEMAIELEADIEWIEALKEQAEVVQMIQNGFNASIPGWDDNFDKEGKQVLN